MQYRNYSDADIVEAVKTSKSIAQVLRKLGLVAKGGNYLTIQLAIARLQLDASHFTGQAWQRGKVLPVGVGISNLTIKKSLIARDGHECSKCHLTEWLGLPIPLELDHIDGNRFDHSPSNLRILCPNCHAQTPTWKRKKR